jgi:heme oxygenase
MMSKTPEPPLLVQLRQATRASHEAIEKHVDVLRPNVSSIEYRHLLGRFYGFYAPLELRMTQVAGLNAACPDYAERRKTARLEQDLCALGLSVDAVARLPRCTELPALDTVADALGCLYVTEGATLGGAIISRHVFTVLGVTAETGGAFFASYGDERGSMWKGLGEMLNTISEEPNKLAVIRSACATFRTFDIWLQDE